MDKYEDIINLKYPKKSKYPKMSIENRSAQFAPFSALVTYNDAVKETARLTNEKIELTEEEKELIDLKLQIINKNLLNKSQIKIIYFVKDKRKNGGKYIDEIDTIKKIDLYNKNIVLSNNKKIAIEDIININSDEINI